MPIWVSPMIKLWLLLVMVPGALAANPWADFEAKCLTPMQNVDRLVTSDFVVEHDRREFSVHLLQVDSVIVRVTTDKSAPHRQSCVAVLSDEADWPDALRAFESWREDAIASGRYVAPNHDIADGTPVGGNAIYSNEVREPRLRVGAIGPDTTGGPAIFAEDTDLES